MAAESGLSGDAPGGRAWAAALVLVVALGAAAAVAFRLHTGIVLEDAFITFRYARNLAAGEGIVFNPGDRVLGTTTPLLTLALGALGALFGPERIPLLANLLMIPAAAGAGALTCLALWAAGLPRALGVVAAVAVLLHPDLIWTAAGGMETPLVLFFMAASFLALARGRPALAGTAAGLLVVTRIDGAVWAACLLGLLAVEDRRACLRAALAAAAAAAPWHLFAWAYFGSPVPHSVVAKRIIGPSYDLLSLEHLGAFARWAAPFAGAASAMGTAAGLALYAAGAAALGRTRARRLLWLPVIFPPALAAALYAGRSPLYFDWYLVPAAYASIVAGWIGAWGLYAWAADHEGGRAGLLRAVRAAAAAFCLAQAVLFGSKLRDAAAFHRAYQTNETGLRRAVGEWLARETPPEAVVAMEAVGYQAWYSGRRVIDLAGLVSPEVVALRRESATNAAAFAKILERLRPDYLVLRSGEADENRHFHGGPLFEDERGIAAFVRTYEEARRFEAPLPELWGPTARITIFRRRGPEPPRAFSLPRAPAASRGAGGRRGRSRSGRRPPLGGARPPRRGTRGPTLPPRRSPGAGCRGLPS